MNAYTASSQRLRSSARQLLIFVYLYLLMEQVLLMEKDINPEELDFLLRYPAVPGLVSPVDFLSNLSWGGIKVLQLDYLPPDIVIS